MVSIVSRRILNVFKQYPIVRGMVTYAVIWPASNLFQQSLVQKRDWKTLNWPEAARFSVYGACYVAPTLYMWVRCAGVMFPGSTLKTAVLKAAIETVTYTPLAMISFFFFMSLLQMKSLPEAIEEAHVKFFPTYKVGASVWPILAIVNFTLVPERNRVPFISFCSFIWTSFLAYMKHLEAEEVKTKVIVPILL